VLSTNSPVTTCCLFFSWWFTFKIFHTWKA